MQRSGTLVRLPAMQRLPASVSNHLFGAKTQRISATTPLNCATPQLFHFGTARRIASRCISVRPSPTLVAFAPTNHSPLLAFLPEARNHSRARVSLAESAKLPFLIGTKTRFFMWCRARTAARAIIQSHLPIRRILLAGVGASFHLH